MIRIVALFILFPVGNNLFERKIRSFVFNKTGKRAKKLTVCCLDCSQCNEVI